MRNTGIYVLAMAIGALALAGCGRESADWKSATAADTSEAYQQFLQQHPTSSNASQAQARIKQLAEDHDWQAAAAADTRDAYQQFVAQHADSKWTQEARIRIENFAQAGAAAASSASSAPAVSGAAASATDATVSPPAVAPPQRSPSATTPASKPAAAKLASATARDHFVQLGAFQSKARAESQWKLLSAKYPKQLQALTPRYLAGKSKHGSIYRLQVGVPSATSAKGLCASLKKHSQACVPVST